MKKYLAGLLMTGLVFVAGAGLAQASTLTDMQAQVSNILTQVQQLPSDTIAQLQLKVSLLTGALGLQRQVNTLIQHESSTISAQTAQQSVDWRSQNASQNIPILSSLSPTSGVVGTSVAIQGENIAVYDRIILLGGQAGLSYGVARYRGEATIYRGVAGGMGQGASGSFFYFIIPTQGTIGGCTGCAPAPIVTLPAGVYDVRVEKSGYTGSGPTSNSMQFQLIDTVAPTPNVVISPANPSISISSPVAGQTYYNGEKDVISNIQWSTSNFGGMSVSIVLDGPAIHKVLADTIPNTGNYTWHSDTTLPSGNYTIRIIGVVPGSEKGPFGEATTAFYLNTYVPAPTISVISPTTGNVLSNGEKAVITHVQWTTSNFNGLNVSIVLEGSGNGIYKTIANTVPNTGTYAWATDSTVPSGIYRLRLMGVVPNSEKGPFGEAYSGYFTITTQTASIQPTPLVNYDFNVSMDGTPNYGGIIEVEAGKSIHKQVRFTVAGNRSQIVVPTDSIHTTYINETMPRISWDRSEYSTTEGGDIGTLTISTAGVIPGLSVSVTHSFNGRVSGSKQIWYTLRVKSPSATIQ
ncbi:MAG: hypothetical protein WC764_01960 [Candidatus Paceibacterota bacterium]